MAKKILKNSEPEDKPGVMQSIYVNPGQNEVNPFAIGGSFLRYCVNKGWIIQQGVGRDAKYFVTDIGKIRLKEFGIIL